MPLALTTQTMDQRIDSALYSVTFHTHTYCNYHHYHPRLAPVCPRSSVGRATNDQIQRSWVRLPPRPEIIVLCLVRSPISLLGLTLSRNFMGSLEHFNIHYRVNCFTTRTSRASRNGTFTTRTSGDYWTCGFTLALQHTVHS